MRDALDFYPYPFINASGEAVPSYAIMQVGAGWTEANNRDYFNAVKPNGSGKKFLINSPLAVSTTTNQNDGMATDLPAAYVRYTGATPVAGQEWGPVASSWAIAATGSGYLIIGDATTIDGVAVVRVAAIAATNNAVFEFRNCSDSTRRLYLDNPEIGEQNIGTVAVIRIDGVIDCWRLIGAAPRCATGSCAEIIAWGANCSACSVCFYLTPCGGGSPTFVRGVEWYEYEGRVVKLDGPGHEGCYTVNVAEGCPGTVNESLGVQHVTDSYANCDGCGCYELENCADSGDVIYVSADLATFLGEESAAATIGRFIKKDGVCYEITGFANPCGAEPADWGNILGCGFFTFDGCPQVIDSCNGCCYMLTPCPDQPGDPEVAYYRLNSGDPDLTEFIDEETGESNGRVIRLAGVCYTVSVPESCPEEDVILGLPTVEEEYDECEDCIVSCWERCDAAGTYLKTYSDMKEVASDGVAKRAEDGFCYKRATLSECDGDPIVAFTIEEVFNEGEDSCEICQDPKVKLTPSCGGACPDCNGSSSGGSSGITDEIITDDASLFGAVGRWVKVDGQCYLVEWTTEEVTQADVCFTGPYDSCAACADAPSKKRVVSDVAFNEAGELIVTYVDLYGRFNVCGKSDNEIAESEECEE